MKASSSEEEKKYALEVKNLLKKKSHASKFYFKIYQSIKHDQTEKVNETVAKQLNISQNQLTSLLNGNNKALAKICRSVKANELWSYFLEVEELLEFERSLAKITYQQKQNALSNEIWTNGSLSDGEFDLIVDLNVIDAIYFGKKSETLSSRVMDIPLDFSKDKEEQTSKNNKEEIKEEQTSQENDSSKKEEDIKKEQEQENKEKEQENEKNQDKDKTTKSEKFICQDPSSINLENIFTNQNITEKDQNEEDQVINQNQNNNQESRQKENQKQEAMDSYLGGDFPIFPDNENSGCQKSQDSIEMFGGYFCIPHFCKGAFCLEIELIPGRKEVADKTNCIKCLIDFADHELEETYLQKAHLAPRQNSLEFFWLRTPVFLADMFNFNPKLITKPPYKADKKTPDTYKSTVEEIRSLQNTLFPEIIGNFIEKSGKMEGMMSNKAMLNALLTDTCDNISSIMPEGISSDEMIRQCSNDNKNLKSRFLLSENQRNNLKQENIDFLLQRWQVWNDYLKEFSENAKAINELIRKLPPSDQIDKITNKDCKAL